MLNTYQQKIIDETHQSIMRCRALLDKEKVDTCVAFFNDLLRMRQIMRRPFRKLDIELDRLRTEHESWDTEAVDALTDMYDEVDCLDDELMSILRRFIPR